MPRKEPVYIALDLETTGFSFHRDRIVEIGAIRFAPGKILEVFESLVDPGMPIPREAVRIHGITDEMVAGVPSIDEVLPPFLDFVGAGPLVIHNAPFDLRFLDAAMKRYSAGVLVNSCYDTCVLARKTFPGLKSYSLKSLVRSLKIPEGVHHRSVADSEYAMKVFERCLSRLGGPEEIGRYIKTRG